MDLVAGLELVLLRLLMSSKKGVWPSAQAEGRERRLGRGLKHKDMV